MNCLKMIVLQEHFGLGESICINWGLLWVTRSLDSTEFWVSFLGRGLTKAGDFVVDRWNMKKHWGQGLKPGSLCNLKQICIGLTFQDCWASKISVFTQIPSSWIFMEMTVIKNNIKWELATLPVEHNLLKRSQYSALLNGEKTWI